MQRKAVGNSFNRYINLHPVPSSGVGKFSSGVGGALLDFPLVRVCSAVAAEDFCQETYSPPGFPFRALTCMEGGKVRADTHSTAGIFLLHSWSYSLAFN